MTAIKVDKLSKIYKLYDRPQDRVKESLHPFRRKYHRDFYALRDVSFEVQQGETVGIIGKNGSGKSTLLKIITGILTPTSGNVEVNGRVSSLLELGAGFNPEFTGIENIYLNGTIMGYTKEEMDDRLDDILSFADIGDFVYQQVKTYSSGMFVRLAFAVAINVDPDILIIDEALSVGDIRFQLKCFNRFREFQNTGKTILFVTHDTSTVLEYCNKAIWLDNGIIRENGSVKQTITDYIKEMRGFNSTNQEKVMANEWEHDMETIPLLEKSFYYNANENRYGNFEAEIIGLVLANNSNQITNQFYNRESYNISLYIKINKNIDQLYPSIGFKNKKGQDLYIYRGTPMYDNTPINNCRVGEIIRLDIQHTMPLTDWMDNEYTVTPSIARNIIETDENPMDDCVLLDIRYNCAMIKIIKDHRKYAGPYFEINGPKIINIGRKLNAMVK